MRWMVTWYVDNNCKGLYGFFGPFDTQEQAQAFADKHDKYYPTGAVQFLHALNEPSQVRGYKAET